MYPGRPVRGGKSRPLLPLCMRKPLFCNRIRHTQVAPLPAHIEYSTANRHSKLGNLRSAIRTSHSLHRGPLSVPTPTLASVIIGLTGCQDHTEGGGVILRLDPIGCIQPCAKTSRYLGEADCVTSVILYLDREQNEGFAGTQFGVGMYLPSYALFSDGGQRAHAVHIKADLIRRLTYTKGYLDFMLYCTPLYVGTYVSMYVFRL